MLDGTWLPNAVRVLAAPAPAAEDAVPTPWPTSTREPAEWIAAALRGISPRLRAYWFPEMRAWWVMHYDALRPSREVGRARCLRYQAMAREEGIYPSAGKQRLAHLMAQGWSLLYSTTHPHLGGADLLQVSVLWHATWETVRSNHQRVRAEAAGEPRRAAQLALRQEYARDRGALIEKKVGRGQIVMPPIASPR